MIKEKIELFKSSNNHIGVSSSLRKKNPISLREMLWATLNLFFLCLPLPLQVTEEIYAVAAAKSYSFVQ